MTNRYAILRWRTLSAATSGLYNINRRTHRRTHTRVHTQIYTRILEGEVRSKLQRQRATLIKLHSHIALTELN